MTSVACCSAVGVHSTHEAITGAAAPAPSADPPPRPARREARGERDGAVAGGRRLQESLLTSQLADTQIAAPMARKRSDRTPPMIESTSPQVAMFVGTPRAWAWLRPRIPHTTPAIGSGRPKIP